jgi:hypothetical protein
MRAKPRPVRAKPAIAYANRDGALARIASKRDLLIKIATRRPTDGSDVAALKRVLAGLPTSVRQFNQWTAECVPAELMVGWPTIHRNAPETLRQSDLVESVKQAIALVQVAHAAATEPSTKALKVARLQRDLALANSLREIAERAVLELRSALMDAEDEKKALQNKLDAARREGARNPAMRLPEPAKKSKDSKVVQLESARARPRTKR